MIGDSFIYPSPRTRTRTFYPALCAPIVAIISLRTTALCAVRRGSG